MGDLLLLNIWTAAAAKSRQSCPTLCNPIDGSPPGSSVPGILQARTPEWAATSFSNAWEWKVRVKLSGSSWPRGLQPTRLLCPWDFPGKSSEVGCHALLQGIFPTQGSNLGLPHCRQILHQLSDQANPTPSLCCHVNGDSGSDPRPAGLEGGPGDTGHHLDPVGCWGVSPAYSLDTAPDRASLAVNTSHRGHHLHARGLKGRVPAPR